MFFTFLHCLLRSFHACPSITNICPQVEGFLSITSSTFFCTQYYCFLDAWHAMSRAMLTSTSWSPHGTQCVLESKMVPKRTMQCRGEVPVPSQAHVPGQSLSFGEGKAHLTKERAMTLCIMHHAGAHAAQSESIGNKQLHVLSIHGTRGASRPCYHGHACFGLRSAAPSRAA